MVEWFNRKEDCLYVDFNLIMITILSPLEYSSIIKCVFCRIEL